MASTARQDQGAHTPAIIDMGRPAGVQRAQTAGQARFADQPLRRHHRPLTVSRARQGRAILAHELVHYVLHDRGYRSFHLYDQHALLNDQGESHVVVPDLPWTRTHNK